MTENLGREHMLRGDDMMTATSAVETELSSHTKEASKFEEAIVYYESRKR